MLIVMKFGGSSLETNEKIGNAAKIIEDSKLQGNDIVAVVSAQGKTTDELIKKAESITALPSPRESDVLLSTGEQVSMSLLAIKLNSAGCRAVSLCGWQAGIHTDERFGNANITHVDTKRIREELEKGNVVIIAGFQGINNDNDITTLGRGGSDTTAIALTAALKADACFIYTDVNGVYTADPRVVEQARKHCDISYDELLEMSTLGAKVLHNRSVLMAKRSGVEFEVLSSFDGQRGTLVHDFAQGKYISGIVCDDNVAMINVIGIDSGEATCELFSLLAKNRIQVDIIIRSPRSFDGLGVVSFSVPANTAKSVIWMLNEKETVIGYDRLYVEEDLAKISAVGSGIADSCIVASKMLNALNEIGLEPKYITTGEIRISVIIPKTKAAEAEKAIHSALIR
ncbi:MAG: Aspartokinase [Firmicutes bacterium ADurb.Bin182]|nr:MAG: Aspartokinase [Firmicutes bacterium ADurb.Bin182]